jgi:hypothetical protein
MEEEEFEIEDILKPKTKRIKSGKKGKRVELDLVKKLNDRFDSVLRRFPDWGKFSRTIGSGNRWGQNVHLSKKAIDNYTGDLVCPENFKFVLESKGGYNEIDLCSSFDKGQAEIDKFLKQVKEDSKRTNRLPILLWKKDRKPRLAFMRKEDLPKEKYENLDYYMRYRSWIIINFKDLLELEDTFFFNCDIS